MIFWLGIGEHGLDVLWWNKVNLEWENSFSNVLSRLGELGHVTGSSTINPVGVV